MEVDLFILQLVPKGEGGGQDGDNLVSISRMKVVIGLLRCGAMRSDLSLLIFSFNQGAMMKQPLKLTTRQGERIAVVAGLRTPFAKQATAFHGVPAVDLGKLVVSELLARTDLDPKLIDQLVFGQVVQMPEAPNIAREIVLGTGMSVSTDAYSVSRACATSFQAVANVTESIMAGTVDIAIAGGADSSSVLPIGVSKTLARALVDLNKARNLQQRFNILRRLRIKDLMPVPPAVAEYSTGLSM